ncbi:hypothetical protein BKH46_06335 [Helicobacter sp. 12S02634-8]|nr:hypothetical protein BKH46_06335 [Helicobacter sp. 12S02634-8]
MYKIHQEQARTSPISSSPHQISNLDQNSHYTHIDITPIKQTSKSQTLPLKIPYFGLSSTLILDHKTSKAL